MIFNKKGFTLIELTVVIALITMLIVLLGQYEYRGSVNKQRALSFNTKVQNFIEKYRNNALLGKGVGTNLTIPAKIILTITSEKIEAKYNNNTTTLETYTFEEKNKYNELESFKCDGTETKVTSTTPTTTTTTATAPTTATITLEGSDMSEIKVGSSLCKILEIKTKYKETKNIVLINRVSGVIESKIVK